MRSDRSPLGDRFCPYQSIEKAESRNSEEKQKLFVSVPFCPDNGRNAPEMPVQPEQSENGR